MIDSTKLLPRRSQNSSPLSGKTMKNISIIKKDLVKIDDLLKERLVLSKVRYGILKRQAEQLRRRKREETLEKNTGDEKIDINLKKDPKNNKQGRGGLLTALFVGLIGGIGFLVIKSVPLLKKIGKVLTSIAKPFMRFFTAIGSLIGKLTGNINKNVDNLKSGEKKEGKRIKQLPNLIKDVGDQLDLLGSVLIGQAIFGLVASGVSGFQLRKVVNAARSKRLLTGASAVQVSKAIQNQKKVKRVTTDFSELAEGQKPLRTDLAIIGEQKKFVKKYSTNIVEKAAETVTNRGAIRITDKNFEKILNNVMGGDMATTGLRSKTLDPGKFTYGGSGDSNLSKSITKKLSQSSQQLQLPLGLSGRTFGVDARFKQLELGAEADATVRTRVQTENAMDPLRTRRPGEDILGDLLGKPPDNVLREGDQIGETVVDTVKSRSKYLRELDAGAAARQTLLARQALKPARAGLKTALKISKSVLRQTLGAVPLLGDLAVLLLDIYVFKEIPARAGFKTIGSIIGSVLGGLAGAIGGPPGAIIGAIVGSIGGDILGAMIFDMVERNTDYGPYNVKDKTGLSKTDFGRAGIGGVLKGSTIGPIVKDFAGEIKKDKLFINKGPVEFLLDNNTYMAFEDEFPGLVQDLNLREGKDVIDKLREVMSYDKKRKAKTKILPFPVQVVAQSNQDEGSLTIESRSKSNDFLALVTQETYRRS